jgi:acetyl-CoA acetyltransferase
VRNRHRAAFIGVGLSDLTRFDERPLGLHAVEAARRAIDDAGLAVEDIDGIACIPRQPFDTEGALIDGLDFVSTNALLRYLGLSSVRWGSNVDIMLAHSLTEAINAVEAGAANHALVFRSLRSSRGGYGQTQGQQANGDQQYRGPYGRFPPADFAQMWHRYQHVYNNGSREQMATFVVQERENGLRTEWGYWSRFKPESLTREAYLDARIISSPFGLYDCDIPVHGCGAFIITTAERAADLTASPAYVLGTAAPYFAMHENVVSRGHTLEFHEECGRTIASNLWADSGLGPSDISVANLYDGFSFIAMLWLEALGFAPHGEAFDYIQDGRIAPDGELPLNTGGGNLGTGRLHGVNQALESVLQVTGRAGARQIDHAETAVFTVGPPARGAAVILGRSPRD